VSALDVLQCVVYVSALFGCACVCVCLSAVFVCASVE